MKKLRVAMIAPPWLAMPIRGYGGIELVIQNLVDGLRGLDVEVELFANGARRISGVKTHSFYKTELFDKIDWPYYDAPLQIMQTHLLYALRLIENGKFDIIHDHNPYIGPAMLSLASRIDGVPPVLHTFHGPPFSTKAMLQAGQEDNRPQLEQQDIAATGFYATCISEALADMAPKNLKEHMLPAVHNAIEVDKFPFKKNKQNYYITLARFTADKGQHVAAKFAAKTKKRLRMAGVVAGIGSNQKLLFELANPLSTYRRNEEFRYYSDKVLPYILRYPRITYAGNLSGQRKMRFISEAKALLFPIQWEEPFGMAVIEALACGTPVVAMNRGAMPEIIEHGKTGFLANNEKEFFEYAERVDEIDPAACRKSVEERFSADAMAAKYLDRYRQVIEHAKSSR